MQDTANVRGTQLPTPLHPLLDALAVLLLYILTAPRSITLEDAGIFQLVCHLGGISHPPGYPLFTMLCQNLVPAQTAFAGNMVSAIAGAIAVGVFHVFSFDLTKRRSTAHVAALAWGTCITFWSQAIIIEVYTLAALLFAVLGLLLHRFASRTDNRYWYAACLVAGLSLTNHWPLMMLVFPGLLLLLFPAGEYLLKQLRSPGFVLASLAAFCVGLTPYVRLVMNEHTAFSVFGQVDGLSNLARYIARTPYAGLHGETTTRDQWQYAVWLAKYGGLQFGWVGIPFMLTGLVASATRLPIHVACSLVIMPLVTILVLSVMGGLPFEHYYRAVFRPYPILAFAANAFWFALGLAVVSDWLLRHSRNIATATPLLLAGAVAASNFVTMDRSGNRIVEQYARTVLTSLPENAILFVRGDNEAGPFGYLHYVLGVRPDIELREWDNLLYPNRLAPAFASPKERDAAINELLRTTHRPVFVTEPRIAPRISYGPYHQYAPGLQSEHRFAPATHQVTDLMLNVYENDLVQDPHEQYFVYMHLVDLARHYLGYLYSPGFKGEPEVAARATRLQQTFPGRAVTLELLAGNALSSTQRQALLEMAIAAVAHQPEFADAPGVMRFYSAIGNLLEAEGRMPEALEWHQRSLAWRPTPRNPSICRILSILAQAGDEANAAQLRAEYEGVSCPAGETSP